MQIGTWKASQGDGSISEEQVLSFDKQRAIRILICPALFDEANKMRRFAVEVMRRLNAAGIDSFLPDLPGTNDSVLPLNMQTLALWRSAVAQAFGQFEATHILAIRAGALLAPKGKRGWRYEPIHGDKLVRGLVRAELIGLRELGNAVSAENFLQRAYRDGARIAGWQFSAEMVCQLEEADFHNTDELSDIRQADLPGGGLWLRAEPDFAPEQADAIVDLMLQSLENPQ